MTEQETVTETVECQTGSHEIEIEEAHKVLDQTYVCDPDLFHPSCLWYWNNENYNRSEFYD